MSKVDRKAQLMRRRLQLKRRHSLSNADSLHIELRTAFGELDSVINDGSLRIKKEHEKQMSIRRANAEALDANLSSLVEDYNARIAVLLESEKQQQAFEELWYAIESVRLRAEQGQALRLIGLKEQGGKRGNDGQLMSVQNRREQSNYSLLMKIVRF